MTEQLILPPNLGGFGVTKEEERAIALAQLFLDVAYQKGFHNRNILHALAVCGGSMVREACKSDSDRAQVTEQFRKIFYLWRDQRS